MRLKSFPMHELNQAAKRLFAVLGRLWLRGFLLVFRLDNWIRRRLTPAGQLLACFLLVSAVFGVNTRATSAYLLAALTAVLARCFFCIIGSAPQIYY